MGMCIYIVFVYTKLIAILLRFLFICFFLFWGVWVFGCLFFSYIYVSFLLPKRKKGEKRRKKERKKTTGEKQGEDDEDNGNRNRNRKSNRKNIVA